MATYSSPHLSIDSRSEAREELSHRVQNHASLCTIQRCVNRAVLAVRIEVMSLTAMTKGLCTKPTFQSRIGHQPTLEYYQLLQPQAD